MRRPFRRSFGPLRPRRVPPLLQRANRLLQQGRPAEALVLYEQLLSRAERNAHPRSPALHLQAARAALQAGQTERALEHVQTGFRQMAQRGQWAALQRTLPRALEGLRAAGLNEAATELENWAQKQIPDGLPQNTPLHRGLLPTHCPACGAPVDPRETEWLDTHTAECPYCGSPLRAQ